MNMAAGKLKPDQVVVYFFANSRIEYSFALQAFMQGKMKLKGNIAKAMKLKNLLDPKMLKAKI